jgi:hypothetical protein
MELKDLLLCSEQTSTSLESSAMWRHVVTMKWTDVSEVHTASIIRVINRPDDGGSIHL